MKEARRFRLTLVAADGSAREIELPELDVTFPLVDVFPGGRILVVATRCAWRGPEDFDLNGAIVDPGSSEVSRILLGDGIERTYVDALGRIWVSYFDEGVFGNFGWGGPGPTPIGAAGLVCFSETGDKIWEYSDDNGMADCYALNVCGEEAAMFFYTDFPLCRISRDFRTTHWRTELRGCHEFAISAAQILFTAQYKEPPDTAYRGQFDGSALSTRRVRLQLPDGSPLPRGQLLGRGAHLYFFDESSVYRASLD
ncbi:MAG: hypothetical protein JOY90_29875 [Bradyrhizobium sp.]|nr:hypothetical protein [Bradyrhizobium sp.]